MYPRWNEWDSQVQMIMRLQLVRYPWLLFSDHTLNCYKYVTKAGNVALFGAHWTPTMRGDVGNIGACWCCQPNNTVYLFVFVWDPRVRIFVRLCCSCCLFECERVSVLERAHRMAGEPRNPVRPWPTTAHSSGGAEKCKHFENVGASQSEVSDSDCLPKSFSAL